MKLEKSAGIVAQHQQQIPDLQIRCVAGLVLVGRMGYAPKLGQEGVKLLPRQEVAPQTHNGFLAPVVGGGGRDLGQEIDQGPILAVFLLQLGQPVGLDGDVPLVQIQMRDQQWMVLLGNGDPAQEHPQYRRGMELTGGIGQHRGDAAVQRLMGAVGMAEADDGQVAFNGAGQKYIDRIHGGGDHGPTGVDLADALAFHLLVTMNLQGGFAYGAAGLQGQDARLELLHKGEGGAHIDIIGLQIALKFGAAGVCEEGVPQIGNELQQIVAVDLPLGAAGSHLTGAAEILVHQIRQGNVENVAQVDDQAQGEVPGAGEDQAQISLANIQTTLFQNGGQSVLAVITGPHQGIKLAADGVFVLQIQFLGQCRLLLFCHGDTPLSINYPNFIISQNRKKSIFQGTLFC